MSSRKRIEELEKQLEAAPNDVRLLQKLGEVHQRAGDLPKAAAAFERVADHYTDEGFFLKAVALLKQCQKLHERHEVNFKLASLHAQLQLVGEAMSYLLEGIKKATTPSDLELVEPAVRHVRDCYPNDAGLRLRLVHLLVRANRIDSARSELSATIDLLRQSNADLAVVAEQLDVGGEETSVLGALIRLRSAVERRANSDHVPSLLDFSQPN